MSSSLKKRKDDSSRTDEIHKEKSPLLNLSKEECVTCSGLEEQIHDFRKTQDVLGSLNFLSRFVKRSQESFDQFFFKAPSTIFFELK